MTRMRLVLALLAALAFPIGAYATCCNGGPQAATGSTNTTGASVQGAGPGAQSMPVNDNAVLTGIYATSVTPPYPVTQSGPWIMNSTDTPLDGLTYTGTLSAAGVIPFTSPGQTTGVIDLTGYAGASVAVTANASLNTITFQGSNDTTNWYSVYSLYPQGSSGQIYAPATATTPGIYMVPKYFRYLRVNITTYVGGATNVSVVQLSAMPPNYAANQGAAASYANPWFTSPAPVSTPMSMTVSSILSAASTNSTQIKTSGGNLYSFVIGNTTSTAACVHWYNVSSAPTVGTTAQAFATPIPANQDVTYNSGMPLPFSTGIFYSITASCSATDATAVAAGQIVGHVLSK